MRNEWFSRTVLSLCCVLGTSGLANATTWDFSGSGGEGTIGNSLSFTADGVTVTATAWSYTTTGFEAARLGQWSPGIGVCNTAEMCGDPVHQADNQGRNEYVLFQFSAPIDPLSIYVSPYGTYDRDVSYWTGTVTLPSDLLAGETYGSLTSLGFSPRIDVDGTVSSFIGVDVPLTSPHVTALLFGPKYDGGGDDYFKIRSLTGSVPEPSALLLLGLGMIGLIWFQAKRGLAAY